MAGRAIYIIEQSERTSVPILIALIFIGVPILEIAVFIRAGALIGLWPTIAMVLLTGILGVALLRMQGLAVLARVRQSLDQGRIPVEEVFTGLCLLVAGALLLTPGFVTDTVGFLLLVPAVRAVLGRWAFAALRRGSGGRVWVDGDEIVTPRRNGSGVTRDAIDVDFTEVDRNEPEDRRGR